MAEDRSNEQADVARRILELSDTVDEAINYMLDRIGSLRGAGGVPSDIIRDVGEGLISLENAVSAISGPIGSEPEDVLRLTLGYDELSERMDALIEAYVDDRADELSMFAMMLRESYTEYCGALSRCFRNLAVM